MFNRNYISLAIFLLVLIPYLLSDTEALAQEVPQTPSVVKGPQIVGGQPADQGEYPWQAMLLDKDGRFACAGVLIQPTWILTAGHCVTGNGITKVVLGAHQRTESEESSRQTIPVTQIFHHAGYDSGTLDNDIALIQLSQPALLNDAIATIPIVTPADKTLITAGTIAVVTGWGTTSEGGTLAAELQEVALPIVNRAACTEAYGALLSLNLFCAGVSSGGKDSCQGDSGGPLIVPDSGSEQGWKVGGIVSSGNGCARVGYYGLYTKVINYHAWIVQQIASVNAAPPTATPTPDATIISTPQADIDKLIHNGDFEAGNNGQWQQKSAQGYPLIVETLPMPALSGYYAAWLGGVDNEVSRLIQPLSFPKDEALYLIFAYQVQSGETECNHDKAKVFLDGKRLLTLALCKEKTTTQWQEIAIDLTRYAGSHHQVQFYTETDQQNPSSWLIEDIYLALTPGNQESNQLFLPEDVEDEQAEAEGSSKPAVVQIYLPFVQR